MNLTGREQERIHVVHAVRDEQGYRVEESLDGKTLVRRVDGVGKVCGSWDLLLMKLAREGKLVPGRTTDFLEFDLFTPQAVKKTIVTRAVRPGEWDVSFDVVQATLDARGVILRGDTGGDEIRACSAREALAFDQDAVVTVRDDLNIDFTFPRYGALEEVALRIEVDGDESGDIFASNEYQDSSFRKEGAMGVYRVVLKPYRDAEAGRLAASEPPCDLTEFLEPTSMEQCDDPAIKAKAAEIVADKTGLRAKVKAISSWININLRKEYTEIAGLSAVDTLSRMGGDCSEHATLFNALTRAIGIPVRSCSGFVFLGEVGGRHGWSQVLIDGRWLHVDTVLDTVGADPRYILFSKHKPGHARDLTLGRRMTQLTTRPARATVESFVVFGKSWAPAQARVAAGVREGRYDNPILGLSFPLSQEWQETQQTYPLASAEFRRGAAQLDVRVIPYRLEMVKSYPWMLGVVGGNLEWREVPAGTHRAQSASSRHGNRASTVWAIEFEDGTLTFQLNGPVKNSAHDQAAVEELLKGMVLLSPGEK